ncbi:alpha-1,3-glucosidase [Aureococcus anophagefferens]|nr:alpha-1,3-glucosidase [Aureococcus anophagefferens]
MSPDDFEPHADLHDEHADFHGGTMSAFRAVAAMNETDFEAAQDALDADEQPDESIRDWIIKFYTEFNPEKLGSVDVILSKYVGREDELVRQLERKYAPIAAGDEPAPAPVRVRTVEEQQELTYHLKAATETIATYFPPDFEAEIAAQLIAQDALYAEDAARAAMDAEAAGYPETKDDDDDASDDRTRRRCRRRRSRPRSAAA